LQRFAHVRTLQGRYPIYQPIIFKRKSKASFDANGKDHPSTVNNYKNKMLREVLLFYQQLPGRFKIGFGCGCTNYTVQRSSLEG